MSRFQSWIQKLNHKNAVSKEMRNPRSIVVIRQRSCDKLGGRPTDFAARLLSWIRTLQKCSRKTPIEWIGMIYIENQNKRDQLMLYLLAWWQMRPQIMTTNNCLRTNAMALAQRSLWRGQPIRILKRTRELARDQLTITAGARRWQSYSGLGSQRMMSTNSLLRKKYVFSFCYNTLRRLHIAYYW